MPSLKDLRNRIASVKSTQKITKAMQMVAVSKLRRAQAAAEAARPYAEKIERVLSNLAGGAGASAQGPRLLAGTGADQTHLLVVCTGERGLCGAFNTSIVRLAREHANTLIAQGKTVKIICVGKKGFDQLRRTLEKNIIDQIDLRAVRTLTFENAQPIAKKVLDLFEAGQAHAAEPAAPDRLRERLAAVDAEQLTPRSALDLAFELIELLRSESNPGQPG